VSLTKTDASGNTTIVGGQQSAIPADQPQLVSKLFDLGTQRQKFVDEIVVNLDVSGSGDVLRVKLGSADNRKDTLTYEPEQQLDGDDQTYWRQTARYFEVQLLGGSVALDWEVTGIELYGQLMQGRR
jgi:hypothetical protein